MENKMLDREEFQQRRETLRKNIKIAQGLVSLNLDDFHASHFSTLEKELEKELKFNVLCVGDFSSGKTTFVNKFLIKDDILPTRATPTTSRLTIIESGEKLSAILAKSDGSEEEITTDVKSRIEAAVAAGGAEIEQIDRVLIRVKSDVLADGLVVIDAPGLNDPDTARMKVTLDYLHQADAILYFLNAQQAWTRSQKEFLEEDVLSRDDIDKLFLLLNYWDLIDEVERDDVISYVNDEVDASISRFTNNTSDFDKVKKPEVIPVSAKTGENKELVEEHIWSYLASKKGANILAHKIHRLNTYIDDAVEDLEEKSTIQSESIEQRNLRKTQLEGEVANYEAQKNEFFLRLKKRLAPLYDEFRDELGCIFDRNTALLANEIQNVALEQSEIPIKKRRLAAKLSFFQRRLDLDLNQAQSEFISSVTRRVEEEKGLLRLRKRFRLEIADAISKNTIQSNEGLNIKTAQTLSGASAALGVAVMLGGGIQAAVTSSTGGVLGWLSTAFIGASSGALVTVALPGLMVAAVGASAWLAIDQLKARKSAAEVEVIGDELIARLEGAKNQILEKFDENRSLHLDAICEHVDHDVCLFFERKRAELEEFMSSDETSFDFEQMVSKIIGLKMKVNA